MWVDSIEAVYYLPSTYDVDKITDNIENSINSASNVSLSSSFFNERQAVDYKYLVRKNYVHTNINTGNLIVTYKSIPLDENAEPLIEEEVNLIEALVWFNIKEYLWQVTMRNPNQFASLLQKAETEWSYYAIQAKTSSIFPKNEDSLRYLRNKYMSILPKLNK